MKKFNKESIQNFMLMHAEKLILAGCLAAAGLFVWMSMGSGDSQQTKLPSDLKKSAQSAQAHIDRDAWDTLAPHRQGQSAAKEHIVNAPRVDGDQFSFTLLGSPAAALDARQDPTIFAPEQPIATRFRTGVMLNLANVESPLADLAPASGIGFQGGGGDDYGDDYGTGSETKGSAAKGPAAKGSETKGSETKGSAAKGSAAKGSAAKGSASQAYLKPDRSSVLNEVNARTRSGLRPESLGISADQITTTVIDAVAVTAVVDFKKQVAAFEKAFAESVAYNARRDRPIYQFLQVQRRAVSDQESPWVDISEDVTHNLPENYPTLSRMPFNLYSSAPEVISPENYDPIISGAIPAFAMLDYQKLASHPALKNRREFPAWQPPSQKKKMEEGRLGDIFKEKKPVDELDNNGRLEDDTNALRNGTETSQYLEQIALQKAGGQYRLVRFFDLLAPQGSFEYRMRVWIGDPNQTDPTDGFNKHRGARIEVDNGEIAFKGIQGGQNDFGDMGKMMGKDDSDLDERPEKIQDVNLSMLSPKVRQRVGGGSDFEMMQENPLEQFYVTEYSEAGQLEQVDLPPSEHKYAYTHYLRFARPSPWSKPVRVNAKLPSADVYAGPTIQAGRQGEPSFQVVVSSWETDLHAKIPAQKNVYMGETLNFNAPVYITHPISGQVLIYEANPQDSESTNYFRSFASNQTVIDAFAGQSLPLPTDKRQLAETPTELLTMDANGNLKVTNQFADANHYRNEITQPDDTRFFGRRRRTRPKKDEFGDDYNDPR